MFYCFSPSVRVSVCVCSRIAVLYAIAVAILVAYAVLVATTTDTGRGVGFITAGVIILLDIRLLSVLFNLCLCWCCFPSFRVYICASTCTSVRVC